MEMDRSRKKCIETPVNLLLSEALAVYISMVFHYSAFFYLSLKLIVILLVYVHHQCEIYLMITYFFAME